MAAPTPDAYSAASGQVVYAGCALPASAAAYRTTSRYLFQDVDAGTPLFVDVDNGVKTPGRAGIGTVDGWLWGYCGPTYGYVENQSKWPWINPGGDWINTAGAPQASTNPHVTFAANTVTTGAASYTADITAGVQAAQTGNRWNAYILKTIGGYRSVAGRTHVSLPAPTISVSYADGTTATLQCVAVAQLLSGTAYTQIGRAEHLINPSVAIEFERPAKAVSSATLNISLSTHSVAASTVNGYLANPTVTNMTPVPGVATGHQFDAGLSSAASIVMSHRFQDGTTRDDWVHPVNIDVWTKAYWNPAVVSGGAADTTKLPTAHLGTTLTGKWVSRQNVLSTVSLVPSTYTGDNFAPLAPGLGALRIRIPKGEGVDGASFPPSGSTGSDLWYLFNDTISGTDTLKDSYVRFYVRIATAPKKLADTKMFRENTNVAEYAQRKGKWGVAVHHWTSIGGNSLVAGGGLGWMNWLGWYDTPADSPLGGMYPNMHTIDHGITNLEWGNIGGAGSSLYPGRWYCVEIRCCLNTMSLTGGSPSDGVMEIWLDGAKVAQHTGWQFRNGPLQTPSDPTRLGPFRQMGPMGLALPLFNGGRLPADEDSVMFFAAIACGTSYIGPMDMT